MMYPPITSQTVISNIKVALLLSLIYRQRTHTSLDLVLSEIIAFQLNQVVTNVNQ
jgi:hypothetical protein